MQVTVTYDEALLAEMDINANRICKDDIFVIHKNNNDETDLQFYKSFTDLNDAKKELASMEYEESHPVVYLYHLQRNTIAKMIIDSYKYYYDFMKNQYIPATS